MSVLSDGIGDRDIPGATARQLVDVSTMRSYPILFVSVVFVGEKNVLVEKKLWVHVKWGFLWVMMEND